MLKKNNFTKHFLILINNVVLVTYCIQNHFRGIVIQDTYFKLQYSSVHNYSATSCCFIKRDVIRKLCILK